MGRFHGQQGVGLIEVLVALLLLSISVLGFAALQLRAVDASTSANSQVTAMNIASDLAERMRANLQAVSAGNYRQTTPLTCSSLTLGSSGGTTSGQATYDIQDASQKACQAGMALLVDDCPASQSTGVLNKRQCVYIGWNKTTLSNGKSDCVDSTGKYLNTAQCLFLEAY